jgi:hypothetical protein
VTFSKTVFINTNRPVGLQKKEARRFAERTGLWKFVMTIIIADHTKQAVVWLKAIRPKGPWTLASIHPETGAIAVKSFKLKELEAMREWIAERNGKLNLYIVINVTKRRMNKKPREVDMARVDFTYVDCDPLDHETPEEAHTRHRANLESGIVPLPSMNYVSGNGLVALWRLDPPVMIKSAEDIENVKAINAALAQRLGGKAAGYDSCHSIDHLFRLPYTLNIPDARKRAKGRVPVLAGDVVNHPDLSYAAYELPQDSPSPSIAPEQTKLGPVENVEDLGELNLPPHVRELVEVAWEDDLSDKYPSRSERDFAGITGLLRNRVRPEQVVGILLNDDYALGERLQERDDPEAAARKEVERAVAKLGAIDAASDFEGIETPSEVDDEPKIVFKPTAYEWVDPAEIPQREWIYKPAYIGGFVSLTIAVGGKGKTSLARAEAAAIASGKPLLGIVPQRCKVWYWNGEDPQDENARGFAAIRLYYKLEKPDLDGWLFTDSGRDTPIKLATMKRGDFIIAKPVVKALIEAIRANDIGVMIVDPFVTSHNVNENDNMMINDVVDQWRAIANATGCAIMLVHHSRKLNGEAASIEAARGASALKDAARVRRAVNGMTETQAGKAGIVDPDRFICADYRSTSFIPPGEVLAWYRFEPVNLGNGECGDGDSIGVVTAVELVGLNLRPGDDVRALEAIRAGGPWSKAVQAGERWIGVPIAQALQLDPADAIHRKRLNAIIGEWSRSGLLLEVVGKRPNGARATFIEAGELPQEEEEEGFG